MGCVMGLDEWLQSKVAKLAGVRMEMLEQLAAAYVLKTNVPPDECELVEEVVSSPAGEGVKMVYRFRRRGEP